MARPLASGKKSVDLAAPVARVSRIRRDPPPKVKEVSLHERNERDRRLAVIGILAFTLAVCVLIFAFSSYSGWSPSQYTIHIERL